MDKRINYTSHYIKENLVVRKPIPRAERKLLNKLNIAEEAAKRNNTTDFLTGLPDRNQLAIDLADAEKKLRDGKSTYAVVFFDVDNLKKVNDQLGHSEGDSLLVRISTILKYCVRDNDALYKIGGDEMIVLLRDIDPDSVDAVCTGLMKAAKTNLWHQLKILKNDAYKDVGLSAGYATPIGDESATDVFKRSDANMYLDKQHRKAYRTSD